MFWNYLITASRNIKRYKGFSILNIIGLSVGMASCILLFLYVQQELSYDNYHKKGDRIHALCVYVNIGNEEIYGTSSSYLTGNILVDELPEVEKSVRFKPMSESLISYQDKKFMEKRIRYADTDVFNIFTWPLVKGNPKTVLDNPNSIAISETLAEKYFGDEEPMGKVLTFNNDEDYIVNGIFRDIPSNSTYIFSFDILVSMEAFYKKVGPNSNIVTDLISHNFRTYVLLKDGVDYRELNRKIKPILRRHAGEEMDAKGADLYLFLHPLRDMYLRPVYTSAGPIVYVWIFSIIAFFILLLAGINFMNLSTARYLTRAKEVGIRKVAGAGKRQLITQFLSESIILSLISISLAIAIADLAIPHIRQITDSNLSMNVTSNPALLLVIVMLTCIIGLVAGAYPAFFYSKIGIIEVLKNKLAAGRSRSQSRQVLTVFQFVVSITLIISTVVIIQQLGFLRHKNPGFSTENVIIASLDPRVMGKYSNTLKQELKKIAGVQHISFSSSIPGSGYPTNDKIPEGFNENNVQLMVDINVDEEFIPALGIELLQGRNFSNKISSDTRQACIINETAAKQYGWENPIGKTILSYNPYKKTETDPRWIKKKVIGVVKNFHLQGMNKEISPLFMDFDPDYPWSYKQNDIVSIKLNGNAISSVIAAIEKTWDSVLPGQEFDYMHYDEYFGFQFQAIERSRSLFFDFAFIAILIACLGLYGMTSFKTERRTKEIGIRKVLGGSANSIFFLLNKDLNKSIIIASIFAYPLAFYFSTRWLADFPYRTELTVLPFIISTLLVFTIGIIVTSSLTIRASTANPVDLLRYE